MHYFFHIRTDGASIPDEEGLDLLDLSAAREEMRASAVDLAKAALRAGSCVGERILELADEWGNVIETLPVRSVLN